MNKKILSFIYNRENKKFLILRTGRSNEKLHGKSKWYTVTGSVEGKESHEEAVRRELLEETGLKAHEICNLRRGCRYKWQGKIHEEKYFMSFVDSQTIKLDNIEVIDFKWLNLNEFVSLIGWNRDKEELKSILHSGLNKKIGNAPVKIDDYTS